MIEPNKHIIQPILTGKDFNEQFPRKSFAGNKPNVLLILDGWGIGPNNAGNAISQARTPNLDLFWLSFPHCQLAAAGEAVGLPRGEGPYTRQLPLPCDCDRYACKGTSGRAARHPRHGLSGGPFGTVPGL